MEEAIRIEGLTREFGSETAVDGLTMSIREGEIFGLVGPDGAGKTTTMRMLTGILEPTSGDAWVNGMSIRESPEKIKDEIGYMSQRFGLYSDLTVMENIDFYADLYGVSRADRQNRLDELLAFSNLTPFKRRRAGNLSGGMKQKLGLACALIHTPRVLFLDEPTNGVDPVSRRDFWRILYQLLRNRVTIMVSTSYLDEAERCNRVGLLDHGKLLACDTPAKVKTLIKQQLIEVRTSSSRRAAPLLEALGVGAVRAFGDRLHVLSEGPREAIPRISAALESHGISAQEIKVVPPSLEDVFMALVPEEEE